MDFILVDPDTDEMGDGHRNHEVKHMEHDSVFVNFIITK